MSFEKILKYMGIFLFEPFLFFPKGFESREAGHSR